VKSRALPSFWAAYRELDDTAQLHARKAYGLWVENPFHPSLHFKCVQEKERIWSVRISRGYRALGVWEEDVVTWFWIGDHDEYVRFLG